MSLRRVDHLRSYHQAVAQDAVSEEELELAQRLYAEWDGGHGTSKSQIEIREWGDATSHGRRFDRLIRRALGVSTSKPSKQSNRIELLESQLLRSGVVPAGSRLSDEQAQLMHARHAALSALRVWNDPVATFKTGTFALLFVAAWNSIALAIAIRDGWEWREMSGDGPLLIGSSEKALPTEELVGKAFPGADYRGLRENVLDWLNLRNSVAHRHLPALDVLVIPQAQAGLLNFETALNEHFGQEYSLADQLAVPLQLSGFRDPGVLASSKLLQASLPVDVQVLLGRATKEDADLLADPTYALRIAFIPTVPASGRSPDAVAHFVRPGEVPEELSDVIDDFVVVPKVARTPRPNLGAKQVVAAVQARLPFVFRVNHHTAASRALKVRPDSNAPDPAKTDAAFCEYVPAAKLHLYNQAWVDRLIRELSDPDRFEALTGFSPVALPEENADDDTTAT